MFRDGYRLWMAAAGVTAALLFASSASAQGFEYRGWGVRGGFSSSPTQIVLGGHIDLGEPAENLRVVPNADIGFGDDFTIVTVNGDVAYGIPIEEAGTIYVGGALGILYWNWDHDLPNIPGFVEPDTDGIELAVAAVAGYEFPFEGRPLALDLKIGITDEYPDAKFMLTYTFRQ